MTMEPIIPQTPAGPAQVPGLPQPGLESILAGLSQGGMPDAQLGKSTLPLMSGMGGIGAALQNLTPDQMQAISQLLMQALGGAGASAMPDPGMPAMPGMPPMPTGLPPG